jgi:hypothetical protein
MGDLWGIGHCFPRVLDCYCYRSGVEFSMRVRRQARTDERAVHRFGYPANGRRPPARSSQAACGVARC